jgi:hypothetical protein
MDTVTRGEELDALAGPMHAMIESMKVDEMDSARAIQTMMDDSLTVVRTPWLAKTKWLERYEGVDMSKLADMIEKPKVKTDWLTDVWNDVGDLMNECFQGLRDLDSRSWERILYWHSIVE